MVIVDLNADLGEGAGTDAEIMPLITSANICCGAHAGDEATIRQSIDLAVGHQVTIGAHPGYSDRKHFGRVTFPDPPVDLLEELIQQVEQLARWTRHAGTTIRYIKTHGALYNQSASDMRFARIVCELGQQFRLPLLVMPGSLIESHCHECGVPVIAEGFADRRYNSDGSLVSRNQPDAVLNDVAEVVAQVRWLRETRNVRTICVHGDTPGAVAFTAAVREELKNQGISIETFA